MKYRLLLTFLFLPLLSACTHTNRVTTTLIQADTIDTALKSLVNDKTLVGVSALVYHNNSEAYFGAFGMANKEKERPVQRDTLFQMYSMTKPITGAVLMTLYDEGLFKLTDPLVQHAPEFKGLQVLSGFNDNGVAQYEKPHRDITILDLMRHTAGWSQWGEDAEQPALKNLWAQHDPMNLNNSSTQMAEQLAKVPLLFQPGARWYYGPGVDVQAFLAERLSGKPYAQLLQERLLDPLKMVDTGYFVPKDKRHRLSAVYMREDDGTMTPDPDSTYERLFTHWPLNRGGEGLVSTLDDYMRFALMLQNGGELEGVRILKPETVALMSSDFMPSHITDKSWLPSKGQVGFGINFAVRTAPPATSDEAAGVVGEFFWDGWTNTLFFIDRKYKLTAVLFNHYYPFGHTPVQKDFRDAVYSLIPEAHAPTIHP